MIRNLKENSSVKGRAITNQRRLLLELLREADDHIDAKELYLRANAKDECISMATVYRSLNLFKELGLIDELRFSNSIRCYYEIKHSPEHQHLICQCCGKVMEFHNPYFQKLVEAVQREHGFKVTKAELYLAGYCQECGETK